MTVRRITALLCSLLGLCGVLWAMGAADHALVPRLMKKGASPIALEPIVRAADDLWTGANAAPRQPLFDSRPAARSPELERPQGSHDPNIRIEGIILGETGSLVVLVNPLSNGKSRLRVGEAVSGWTLVAIRPHSAVFKAANRTLEISLGALGRLSLK